MTSGEKDAVMDDFRQGEIQVLVSTSVVEVGVDVANATLMTIESGERLDSRNCINFAGGSAVENIPAFCCVFGDPKRLNRSSA